MIRCGDVGVKSPAPPGCSGMRFTNALHRRASAAELTRVLERVIDSAEHHVLERDAPVEYAAPRRSRLASGYFVLIGISDSPQLVVRRVDRDREPELLRRSPSATMPGSTPTVETVMWRAPMPKPASIVEDRQRRIDRFPVHERLAHPHEHDVRRLSARSSSVTSRTWPAISNGLRLRENPIAPVAQNEHWSAQPAWDEMQRVRRDSFRDRDCLDVLAVVQAEEKFLRPVGRDLPRGKSEPRNAEILGEQLPGSVPEARASRRSRHGAPATGAASPGWRGRRARRSRG